MKQDSRTAPPDPGTSAPRFPERFECLEFAGTGGFGSVWKVRDTWHDRLLAAKLLCREAESSSWRERFFHEYALLYRLRHPGLIRAYDYGLTADGHPYFTMQWHDGPTLEQYGCVPDQRPRVIWELIDALTFIHRQDLIHADIKSANIRLNPARLQGPLNHAGERAVTLLDFGLTLDADVGEEHARQGTVHYMAPEWFHQGDIDYRVDLYALGVLLFELYGGRPPFEGDDPLLIVRQHLEVQPPDLGDLDPGVPPAVREAVLRLLAKQPEIRDKGWQQLSTYVATQLGREPGSGRDALSHHAESLGRHRRVISSELLDAWLGSGSDHRLLYIRGGRGLAQERVLEALVPDVYRYRVTPCLIDDPDDPQLTRPVTDGSRWAALVTIRPETADRFHAYLRRWTEVDSGPAYLAFALNPDDAATQPLTRELARKNREHRCLMAPVDCVDDTRAHSFLMQVFGDEADLTARDRQVELACGNWGRLEALASDRISSQDAPSESPCEKRQFDLHLAREREGLERAFEAPERVAMTLLAVARTPVDRSVLRALSDIAWSQALARWIDLGYVRARSGRFEWMRPDLADLLVRTLPPERRRIVHRAWAEYWGSFGPEPGTAEHEHFVYHGLRSDAYRRALRAGLDNARYWTTRHQAHRALQVLEQVEASAECTRHMAPTLVFELAIAQAEARRVLARYEEAEAPLRAALQHPAIAGQVRWEAELYKRIGDLCKSLKRPVEGRAALEEALTRFRQLDDRVELSHCLNNIGNILYVAGEIDSALASYEEALELQRELDRPRDIASTLNNIGGLLVLRSEYELATRRLDEAVAIKRTLDDPEELARSLNNLAVAHMETGKFGQASEVLAESHAINVQSGKTGEQLYNLENMALVAMSRGEWTEAMAHCESGLKLCPAAESAQGRLPFLLVLSGVALAQSNYDLVTGTIGEADRILQRAEDPDLELQRLLFGAEWAYWRNRPQETQDLASEVIDRARADHLPTWLTRGYLLRARGALLVQPEDDQARRWLDKALAIAEQTGALPEQIRSRTMLAELDCASGRLDQATEHLRRCESMLLECGARPLFLPFSYALGRFYRSRGDLETALSVFDTARKLSSNLSLPEWTWRCTSECGHLLVQLRRHEEAADHYRSSLDILVQITHKLGEQDGETYMRGLEKAALEAGLRACHKVLVGAQKK